MVYGPSAVVLAYLAWIGTWALGQVLSLALGEPGRFWSLSFFLVIHVGCTGIALPLALLTRMPGKLKWPPPVTNYRWLGRLLCAAVLVAGVVASGSLSALIRTPPTLQTVLKYAGIFTPMTLGLVLYGFGLIPHVVMDCRGSRQRQATLAALASAVALGMAFWVDQLFASIELALIQGGLGLFLGLGTALNGSLATTFCISWLIVMINTLAEDKYANAPWSAIAAGWIAWTLCAAVLLPRFRHDQAC